MQLTLTEVSLRDLRSMMMLTEYQIRKEMSQFQCFSTLFVLLLLCEYKRERERVCVRVCVCV